jgi:hypothetical protein
MVEFVLNTAALKLRLADTNTVVIADTHIGFENTIEGIKVPSQTTALAYSILKICRSAKARKLIHLGDVKHEVKMVSYSVRKELDLFFNILHEYVDEIDICAGNHDGNLKKYLPAWIKLHPSRGFKIGEISFFHGHTWPADNVMNASCILTSHLHPALTLSDTLGAKNVVPCWLKTKFNISLTKARYKNFKSSAFLIVLPAFNEFCGSSINTQIDTTLLGPIFKNKLVELKNADIYLLNGMFVSKYKNLDRF